MSISDKSLHPGISRLENLRRFRAAGFTHMHLSYKWVKPDAMTEQEIVDWEDPLSESGIRILVTHGYDKPLQMEICRHPQRYGEHDDYLSKAKQTMRTLYGMMK